MSGITVVSDEQADHERLEQIYRKSLIVRREWDDWPDPERAAESICRTDPVVVAIGTDVFDDDAIDLVKAIDLYRPEVGIVVLRRLTTSDQALEFLRNGAREVIDLPSRSDEDLQADIDGVLHHVERRNSNIAAPPAHRRSRVIAVMSPKGGTGKTTIATNLAVGLATGMEKQAMLLDLDVQFGDVCSALGLEPEHDLSDAIRPGPVDLTTLKVFLTRHRSSLAVLPPPESLAASEDIDLDDLKRTIAALSDEFRFVVIDSAAGIDEFALVALEFATDLLFVVTPDVPAIRAISKQLEALDRLGIVEPTRHLVINRVDARIGVTQSDIESTLGMAANLTIPTSRMFPLSTNQGVAHIDSGENDDGTRAMRALANHFLPDSAALRSKGRFFSRGR